MHMRIFLLFPLILTLSVSCAHWPNFRASVSVRVHDELGQPLEGAQVQLGFTRNYDATNVVIRQGMSDKNGVFSASAVTSGYIGIRVTHPEFYDWRDRATFYVNPDERVIAPYDPSETPIVAELRRRLNPIPLYARRIVIPFPVEAEEVGFDLEKADWVAPHGRGLHPDFVFLFRRYLKGGRAFDASWELRFSNPGDGIQLYEATHPMGRGSALRMPNHAPLTGYEDTLDHQVGQDPDNRTYGFVNPTSSLDNYFFRVRTIIDEEGEVMTAHYGKIHGPIRVHGALAETSGIGFTYYFNPSPSDTNLELDPARNLFTDLSVNEMVRDP